MNNSCQSYNTCCVCLKEKNVSLSSPSGRTSIKPYCKTCKPIYEGIKKGLIDPEVYTGLDYDTSQLKTNAFGYVALLMEDGRYEKVSLEYAIRLVRQGGAFVASDTSIEMLVKRATKDQDLQYFILERDQNICRYCGSEEGETVDHVIPKWRGGLDTPLNLMCSCKTCNQQKDRFTLATFMRKRKKNLFPRKPDHLTWEQFKKPPKTKVCSCCKKQRKRTYYAKQNTVCGKCKKFEKALSLNYLSIDDLDVISSSPKRVIEAPFYELFASDGTFLQRIEAAQARNMAKKAIVHVDSKEESVHLLFTRAQLKHLYPTETLLSLMKDSGNKVPLAANPVKDLLTGTQIGLYDQKQNTICVVPNDVASRLLKNNLVQIKKKNRITLKSDAFKEKLPNFLLTGCDIEIVDAANKVQKKVPKEEAVKLIQTDQARLVYLNRIQMKHQEPPAADCRSLTQATYRLHSQQNLFIGHISRKAAVNLLEKKSLEVKGKTDVKLTIPLSQARLIEPSLISMKTG